MPIEIRTPEDINKLDALIDSLVSAVKTEQLDADEIAHSTQRITSLKHQFKLNALPNPINALANAKHIIGNKAHRELEASLALAAITQIRNNNNTLPLKLSADKHIHIIMPDTRKCMAMQQAISALSSQPLSFSCSSLQGFDPGEAQRNINQASIVIAGNATPNQSAVEIGGMDDLADNPNFALNNAEQPKALESLLKWLNNTPHGIY